MADELTTQAEANRSFAGGIRNGFGAYPPAADPAGDRVYVRWVHYVTGEWSDWQLWGVRVAGDKDRVRWTATGRVRGQGWLRGVIRGGLCRGHHRDTVEEESRWWLEWCLTVADGPPGPWFSDQFTDDT